MAYTIPIEEVNWTLNISKIKSKSFIPVIGKELTQIQLKEGDKRISFNKNLAKLFESSNFALNVNEFLALRLIDNFDLQEIDGTPLNKVSREALVLNNVVLELFRTNTADNDIYDILFSEFDDISDEEVKLDHLKDLVRIRQLPIFIKTGIDDFLERALTQVGISHQIVNFSDFNQVELPTDLDQCEVIVFNLFGRITDRDYAITDEMELEFLFTLNEKKADWPANGKFFELIQGKTPYILGAGFPDWLMRFFVRIISQERYSKKGSKNIADFRSHKDINLTRFMNFHRSNVIKCKDDNPMEFVQQLISEWSKKYSEPDENKIIYKESVFLSYASENRAVIEPIYKELRKAGILAFFDKYGLEDGDDYEEKLKEEFKAAEYFIPFISEKSLNPKKFVYRREWQWAALMLDLNLSAENNKVIPLLIEPISKKDERIPDPFKKLQFGDYHEYDMDANKYVLQLMAKNDFTKIEGE